MRVLLATILLTFGLTFGASIVNIESSDEDEGISITPEERFTEGVTGKISTLQGAIANGEPIEDTSLGEGNGLDDSRSSTNEDSLKTLFEASAKLAVLSGPSSTGNAIRNMLQSKTLRKSLKLVACSGLLFLCAFVATRPEVSTKGQHRLRTIEMDADCQLSNCYLYNPATKEYDVNDTCSILNRPECTLVDSNLQEILRNDCRIQEKIYHDGVFVSEADFLTVNVQSGVGMHRNPYFDTKRDELDDLTRRINELEFNEEEVGTLSKEESIELSKAKRRAQLLTGEMREFCWELGSRRNRNVASYPLIDRK